MRHKLSEAEQSDVSESELMSLLPPELLTRILQYLSFDDLKASRQVCHAWLLAVSQTNFYKECWVNIAGDTEEIDGALNLFANTINSSFRHFNLVAVSFDRRIAFLQEPFCEYIQSIVLSNSQVTQQDWYSFFTSHVKYLVLDQVYFTVWLTVQAVSCFHSSAISHMSNNQILRSEDEKVNFKENLLFINILFLKNFKKWILKIEFQKLNFKKWILNSYFLKNEFWKVNLKK